MKICFIPIDNRPVCYNLAKDIAGIDDSIEFLIPPRNLLGDLKKLADFEAIKLWLKNLPACDAIILALDTIAYGGLVPSRRSTENFTEVKSRLEELKEILLKKDAKVFAFSSIMRISNNNFNEEEKEYWKDYGIKIFEYSFSGGVNKSDIPQEILDDYIKTRERNFEINKLYLEWQKEGIFDTLIFSKDDCAKFGFNVEEAKELQRLGGITKTGADEIPLTLLARAIEKEIKVFVDYTEPDCINLISNYEDISIEKSVLGQLELGGFKLAQKKEEADIVLIVNNFRENQGELVMKWSTGKTLREKFVSPDKLYCIADVRFANGADNDFVEELLPQINIEKFYGYASWNTSANTLGSLLAEVKVRFKAECYNKNAFKTFQLIRFLDDWAYQANVRDKIPGPCDISELMHPYESRLLKIFNFTSKTKINYSFPWGRKFEVEVVL